MRNAASREQPSWTRRAAYLTLAVVLLLNQAAPVFVGTTYASDFETGDTGATRNYGQPVDVGDPVSAGNGTYHFNMPLLSLGGPMDLRFELIYRSDLMLYGQSLPNTFWWRPFTAIDSPSTISGTLYIKVVLPDSNQISFKKAGGEWTLVGPTENLGYYTYQDNGSRTRYVLDETAGFYYLLDPIEERVYVYRKVTVTPWMTTRIEAVLDRNENQLTYLYATATDTRPSRIEDGLGRSLDLTYGTVWPDTGLKTVTDQGGRRVVLTWESSGADNGNFRTLRSVADPLVLTTTFRYGGSVFVENLIAGRELPRGNTPYTQTYGVRYLNDNNFVRVVAQRDALGNTTTFDYNPNANVVTVHRPDGSTSVYEHSSSHSQPKTITDTTGAVVHFAKNAEEQLTSVTDRQGNTTNFAYHPETGKLASIANARGGGVDYTYAPQEQVFTNPISPTEGMTFTFYDESRADYPDGAGERFTYDARGNLLTKTDRAGQDWSYTYNGRGQTLTETNPAGGVVTYTYDASANLASRTDSDTGTTTYTYDAFNRLTRVTHPDSTSVDIAYDADDRITSVRDGRGNTTSYTYDANGNLTTVTDPLGRTTTYTYDVLDRRVQSTDRLGNTTTYTYDSLGRLASFTDATGLATQLGYNARDWPDRLTIGGRTWQLGYDAEGQVTSRTTPLGHTSTYQRDSLDFLVKTTNALSQSTSLNRDALSRVTAVTDPLSRTLAYGYDQRGLLSSTTAPVVGTSVYTRTAHGLLGQVQDLNDQVWTYATTAAGRPQSLTDPLGRVWQNTFDSRGRISRTSFPDGTTVDQTYDEASNLLRQRFSDGPDLTYAYDSLNRLTSADGVQLAYDAEGRVVNTVRQGTGFGATYDGADRLTSVGYANGTFTVTYSYSPTTGLLTGVSDSLSGAQMRFSYDDDFRPIGITRTNSLTSFLTWDDASRLTRRQDGTFLDLQYTLNAAGQVSRLQMKAPLDPAGALGEGGESFAYNATSELTGASYSYDQEGRQTVSPARTYAWDGASRLVRAGSASLGYDGLGDVVTRTEGLTTTRYDYNAAIGLRPVVAERDENGGQFLRYYVWTPDGRLLYMVDAAHGNEIYFYHFDRSGSTLALTNGSGQISDSYAYDPYGRLLGHQGSSSQPFTFVGQARRAAGGRRRQPVPHEGPLLRRDYRAFPEPRSRVAPDRRSPPAKPLCLRRRRPGCRGRPPRNAERPFAGGAREPASAASGALRGGAKRLQ